MANQRQRRFFAAKPREIYYETLEIYHSQGILRRFVARNYLPINFTLESMAPRNAGQSVSFEPAAMEFTPVQQGNQVTVSLEVQLGRVGSQFKEEIRKINGTGFLESIQGIYRTYSGADLTQPLGVPITLFCSSAILENEFLGLLFEDDNPASVSASKLYLAQDFPGLEVLLG